MNTSSNPQGIEGAKQEDKSDDNGNQTKDCIHPPVIVKPAFPSDVPPAISNTNYRGGEANFPHKSVPNWVEKLTLILEFLGIVGLGIYCWINFRELQVFDSERKTMEGEFQASQVIAEKQLNEIKQARMLDERAWISISNMTNGLPPETNGTIVMQVTYNNTGKTPAINAECVLAWTTNIKTIPKEDGIPNPRIVSALFQPSGVQFGRTEPIPGSVIQGVKNGGPLYVFGTVWYDDIFGKHHWSQFCFLIRPDLAFISTSFHNSCSDAETNQTN
jgi:hypothetical protein